MDRTDERDAQQEPPAELEVTDPVPSLPRTTTDEQVAVGTIPAQLRGFQPRPALLRALNRSGPGASVVRVLIGTRGAGKTQVAAAYARAKLAAGWRFVAWVHADNAGSLLDGMAAVADAAGLAGGGSERSAADRGLAVRHWLETAGDHCLLIFDDARDPDVLRPFVPAHGAAQVVITTASEPVAELGTRVLVDVFSAEEALALLNGRTGLADQAGAAAVAAELGYLPLALDQAAVVIAGQRTGYGAYLDRLRAVRVGDYVAEGGEPCPHGVAEALLLSLKALQAHDPQGLCTVVIEIMAVLSATEVQRELLYTAAQAGALAARRRRAGVSTEMVDRALLRLAEHSLLAFSLDARAVIAHRLVIQVIHDDLVRQGRLTGVWRAVAAALDTHMAALEGAQDLAALTATLKQMTALAANAAPPASDTHNELAYMLQSLLSSPSNVAAAYWKAGRSAEAIPLLEQIVAACERLLGAGRRDTLTAQSNLAAAYQDAGRTDEAISVFERTLAAREQLLGAHHASTLNTRGKLAAAYQEAGRPAEAIPLLEQILAAREQLLGPEHADTLNTRNTLAQAYRETDRAAEAIPLIEQTLAACEPLLGAGHRDTLTARSNLAAAYWEAGRSAEAIPQLEQILAARERLLGPEHADTLSTRNTLARAYRETGRVAEAIPLIEQTLGVQERALGADHPQTLRSRNNLAAAYREAGRAAEAIALTEQTLADCERLLGTDDPRTQATRHNLDLARQDLVDQVGGQFQHDGP